MRLPTQSRRILCVIDTAIGTLLCASVALILALLFHQTRLEVILPLVCLAVVVSVAARFGVATGVLGSIISAMLLAYFVYAPQHSLRIVSHDARSELSWLLLGGISLSFLFTPRRSEVTKEQEKNPRAED
jgi:K+-sensing histidine kinase KdpD